MFTRIALVLIGIACAFLIYDSVQLYLARSSVFNAPQGYSIGPADADLEVIEFLDYSCPHCKSVEPVIRTALERDGRVRLNLKPLFWDETGKAQALLAYAAGKQGKFVEAHRVLLEDFRAVDANYIAEFAKKLGLDAPQLAKDFADPKTLQAAERNREDLLALKARSVPAFLIGPKILYRVQEEPPTAETFLMLFKQARGG